MRLERVGEEQSQCINWYVVVIEMHDNLLCIGHFHTVVHATCRCLVRLRSLSLRKVSHLTLWRRDLTIGVSKGREIGRWGSMDAGLAWAESCFSDLTPARSRCDCVAVEAQRTTNIALPKAVDSPGFHITNNQNIGDDYETIRRQRPGHPHNPSGVCC